MVAWASRSILTDPSALPLGPDSADARSNYEKFVAEGLKAGKRPELTGGGLVRSAGGWQEVVAARRAGIFLKSDERILGDSDFVERALQIAEEHVERESAYRAEGVFFLLFGQCTHW